MSAIRKKPCPYCAKRLQAKSKGRWRNNLARHLQNCAPFQRECIGMSIKIMCALVTYFTGITPLLYPSEFLRPNDYLTAASKQSEIESLERLYKES